MTTSGYMENIKLIFFSNALLRNLGRMGEDNIIPCSLG
jgi:hypothetical protein